MTRVKVSVKLVIIVCMLNGDKSCEPLQEHHGRHTFLQDLRSGYPAQ